MNDEKVIMTKKDYTKEILIAVGATALGVTLIALGMKRNNLLKTRNKALALMAASMDVNLIKVGSLPSDFNVGNLHDMWGGGSFVNATICNLKLEDIGKLGEELLKLDGVTKDGQVQIMIDICNK